MGDFLPTSDLALSDWTGRFVTGCGTHMTAVGLVAADMTALSGAQGVFDGRMGEYGAAQNAVTAARAAKDHARELLEAAIRPLVRRIQAAPGCTDEIRGALGITIPDRTGSTMRADTVADGATRPIGAVDTSQRLRHEIKFWDEATPHQRRKPSNAIGCEIWVKVDGTAPTGEQEMHFVALDTASPYTLDHEPASGGKTAFYMLRWSLKGGVKGPWSETIAATISG